MPKGQYIRKKGVHSPGVHKDRSAHNAIMADIRHTIKKTGQMDSIRERRKMLDVTPPKTLSKLAKRQYERLKAQGGCEHIPLGLAPSFFQYCETLAFLEKHPVHKASIYFKDASGRNYVNPFFEAIKTMQSVQVILARSLGLQAKILPGRTRNDADELVKPFEEAHEKADDGIKPSDKDDETLPFD